MAEQIAVAPRIQRRLYPQENPAVAGYDLCGVSQPCFEIGGDYYDFLWRDPPGDVREGLSATESPGAVRRHPKGRLGLVVADVSGKGRRRGAPHVGLSGLAADAGQRSVDARPS